MTDKHPISEGQESRDTICWREHRPGYVCMLLEGHRDEPMTPLRPAVAQAIAELDAEHYRNVVPDPDVLYPGWKRPPNREGCVICWPKDGSWPCVTRQVANDLRAALNKQEGSK